MWLQREILLTPRPRGFHLVTHELLEKLSELASVEIGVAYFFLQHTSASICLNENADASVRADFETHFNITIPEGASYYRHTQEGPDDLPAHVKSALLGNSLTIPISNGELALGTWQGIYLGEHRNQGGARRVLVTIQGQQYQG